MESVAEYVRLWLANKAPCCLCAIPNNERLSKPNETLNPDLPQKATRIDFIWYNYKPNSNNFCGWSVELIKCDVFTLAIGGEVLTG